MTQNKPSYAWGWELIIDASKCNLEKITSHDNIYNFNKKLVKDIDMVAYGEPQIIHFGSGEKEGYTSVQLIETSNITGHYANDDRAVFLNVFSCKEYSVDVVIDLVKEFFEPEEVRFQSVTRFT